MSQSNQLLHVLNDEIPAKGTGVVDDDPTHNAMVMELVVAEKMDVTSSKAVQANAAQVVIFLTQRNWIRCLNIKIVISCYFITYYTFLPSLQRDLP